MADAIADKFSSQLHGCPGMVLGTKKWRGKGSENLYVCILGPVGYRHAGKQLHAWHKLVGDACYRPGLAWADLPIYRL